MKETPEVAQNALINWLRTLSIYDIALFGAILLFFVAASIGYGANATSSTNSMVLDGRFDSLQKNKMYKDIGYSYDLKLLESSKKYIIKADYANCLEVDLFNTTVKKGDALSIATESGNQASILSIKKGAIALMDINCVHTKTDHISIYIPMLIALSIILLWWMQRKIKQDRANP